MELADFFFAISVFIRTTTIFCISGGKSAPSAPKRRRNGEIEDFSHSFSYTWLIFGMVAYFIIRPTQD